MDVISKGDIRRRACGDWPNFSHRWRANMEKNERKKRKKKIQRVRDLKWSTWEKISLQSLEREKDWKKEHVHSLYWKIFHSSICTRCFTMLWGGKKKFIHFFSLPQSRRNVRRIRLSFFFFLFFVYIYWYSNLDFCLDYYHFLLILEKKTRISLENQTCNPWINWIIFDKSSQICYFFKYIDFKWDYFLNQK